MIIVNDNNIQSDMAHKSLGLGVLYNKGQVYC